MIRFFKRVTKKTFNLLGLDVIRISNNPRHSLLGLKNMPIRTIIDVGANTGQFGRFVSTFFPDASLYCFEPLPEPFKKLSQWAENQNGRVKVFNLAMGEFENDINMFYHSKHSPSSSFLKTTPISETLYPFIRNQVEIPVKLTTLDKFVDNLRDSLIPDILIKVDVQGYEDRVIQGGAETLHKAKACILEVALDELYDRQATFKDILILLSGLGFRYVGNLEQTYADDGHVIYVDSVFIK
jgi:FkbM family methyltransferase